MLIQVHAQEKPAVRRRTIAAAIALLAVSTGLAATLTWGSKGTRTASVFVPHGWAISVRPPPGSVAISLRLDSGRGFSLVFPTSTGALARMLVLRLEQPAGVELQTSAESVLFSFGQPQPHAVGNLPVVWHDKVLGGHEAVEIWDPGMGVAVRVGRVQSGELYAVAVVSEPTRIDPDTYDVFDRFCHSIEDLSG